MPSYESSVVTRASPEAAWTAWTDVAGWSAYDHIESARIEGEFRPGAVITSKAKGLPSSTLTVTRTERPSLWVDESRSPGMRMRFDHVIEPVDDGTRLTERARMPLEFNFEAPQRQPNAVAVDLREKCKSVQEMVLPAK